MIFGHKHVLSHEVTDVYADHASCLFCLFFGCDLDKKSRARSAPVHVPHATGLVMYHPGFVLAPAGGASITPGTGRNNNGRYVLIRSLERRFF